VDPEGTVHNIRNGLLTMSYRHDRYASPVNDYKAGEIAEMKVESLPIVWNVAKGNRIRIDISSSDFPEFSNHTNTVGNWAEQTEYKVANQTIYVGGENASSVTLPILSN
jgi:putative CocE/NonD family hydrolase